MAIKEEASIPFESNADKEFGNDIIEETVNLKHICRVYWELRWVAIF